MQFAYTLDASAKVTQTDVTDQRGNVRRVNFNALGYITSSTYPLGKSEAQTMTFSRNSANGQVQSSTDQLSRTTAYAYDTMGNVTSVTKLYGTTDATTTTDPLGHVTTRAYNSVGQVTSVTDANNHATTYTYSGADLTQVTDALGRSTTFSNDAAGKPIYI